MVGGYHIMAITGPYEEERLQSGRVVQGLQDLLLGQDCRRPDTHMKGKTIATLHLDTYHGYNWPLRGGKITIWEGGTRTAEFVAGVRLQKTRYTYKG